MDSYFKEQQPKNISRQKVKLCLVIRKTEVRSRKEIRCLLPERWAPHGNSISESEFLKFEKLNKNGPYVPCGGRVGTATVC